MERRRTLGSTQERREEGEGGCSMCSVRAGDEAGALGLKEQKK